MRYVSTGATEDNTAESVKDKQFAKEIFRETRLRKINKQEYLEN